VAIAEPRKKIRKNFFFLEEKGKRKNRKEKKGKRKEKSG